MKLGELIIKNTTKNKEGKYAVVQTVSNRLGFVNQDDYFNGHTVASKSTHNFYVIKKGYFAYNPSRIDVGSLAYKSDDQISIVSPLYVSFTANNSKIKDHFLMIYFQTNLFRSQMIFEGGVRNTLNFESLKEIIIPLPSLPEQEKIASCLSSLDTLYEAEQCYITTLQHYKRGLMQNMFPTIQ